MFSLKVFKKTVGTYNKIDYLMDCLGELHQGKKLVQVQELMHDKITISVHNEDDSLTEVAALYKQSTKIREVHYFIKPDKQVKLKFSNNGHLTSSLVYVFGDEGWESLSEKRYEMSFGKDSLTYFSRKGVVKQYKVFYRDGEHYKRITRLDYTKTVNGKLCRESFDSGENCFRLISNGVFTKHKLFDGESRFMFSLENGTPLMIPQYIIDTAIAKKQFNKASGAYKT